MPLPEGWDRHLPATFGHAAADRSYDIAAIVRCHGAVTAQLVADLLPARAAPEGMPLPAGLTPWVWGASPPQIERALRRAERDGDVTSQTGLDDMRGRVRYWQPTPKLDDVALPGPTQGREWLRAPTSTLWRHTLAVNRLGATLVRLAGGRVDWTCWGHEPLYRPPNPDLPYRQGRLARLTAEEKRLLRADALITAPTHSGQARTFVEMDRGTRPTGDLAAKQGVYRRLVTYPPDGTVPTLVWCFDEAAFAFADSSGKHIAQRVRRFVSALPPTSVEGRRRDANTLITTLGMAARNAAFPLVGVSDAVKAGTPIAQVPLVPLFGWLTQGG